MPIELRGRLPGSSNMEPSYSDTVLAKQAAYYGPIPKQRYPDPEWITKTAREFEEAGLDSALVAHRSSWPDVWSVCTWALAATTRLKLVSAHRVGLQLPVAAARSFATIDRLSGGRVMLHAIQGNTEEDQWREGDFLDKATRYKRAGEYFEVFKQMLTSTVPFDFSGDFYHVKGAWSSYLPVQRPYPTISGAGASPEGLAFCARHVDVYALTAEPLESTAELLTRVRAASALEGRTLRFWRDCNFIVAPTDAAAWEKAEAIAEELTHAGERVWEQGDKQSVRPQSVAQQRVLAASEHGTRVGKATYTAISKLASGTVASAFVGSPETVADAVLDYYDLGIETFSIGIAIVTEEDRRMRTELIACLRSGAAERDRRAR
jgi:alkanesulfonate monooxygenase